MNTTPHAETPVTILHRQGDAFVAVSRNLVVVRWTSIPTGDQLAALAHAHRLATGTGAEVLLVNHVARIARPPSVGGELYTRILELVRACDGPTRAVAHVIEVPGTIGAIIRTFLTTLERVAGNGHTRTATHEAAAPAIAWLSRFETGAPWDTEALAAAWRAMERADRSLAA